MTREERGQQIWQVLVSAAHNRQVLTYGLVAKHIGMGSGTLANPLGTVMFYCRENGLPPLTCLVVNKSGRPGTGLPSPNWDRDRERVFDHDWFKRRPPTTGELHSAYEEGIAPRRRAIRRRIQSA